MHAIRTYKILWDIVSYISNLQGFFDFALGCNIPNHIVQRAIEDNDPSDGNVSLDNCVMQALTFWWTSSNLPAVWKSDKIKQGFIKMSMPGVYDCIIKRHPTLDHPESNQPNNNQDKWTNVPKTKEICEFGEYSSPTPQHRI